MAIWVEFLGPSPPVAEGNEGSEALMLLRALTTLRTLSVVKENNELHRCYTATRNVRGSCHTTFSLRTTYRWAKPTTKRWKKLCHRRMYITRADSGSDRFMQANGKEVETGHNKSGETCQYVAGAQSNVYVKLEYLKAPAQNNNVRSFQIAWIHRDPAALLNCLPTIPLRLIW